MTPTRRRTLAGTALAALLASGLLTGCDAAPAFEPGVAAKVGDETITVDRVDEVTESFCEAAEQQLSKDQVIAQHFLRGQAAGALALRAAADQFADDLGVTADSSYDLAVQNAEQSLAGLSEAQRQAFIEVQGAGTYVSSVELAAGRKVLAKKGRDSSNSKAAQAAGTVAFRSWLDDHDIDIDPRFGVSIASGDTKPVDTSLSYAVSDAAKSGAGDGADSDYAAGLPDSQRCN